MGCRQRAWGSCCRGECDSSAAALRSLQRPRLTSHPISTRLPICGCRGMSSRGWRGWLMRKVARQGRRDGRRRDATVAAGWLSLRLRLLSLQCGSRQSQRRRRHVDRLHMRGWPLLKLRLMLLLQLAHLAAELCRLLQGRGGSRGAGRRRPARGRRLLLPHRHRCMHATDTSAAAVATSACCCWPSSLPVAASSSGRLHGGGRLAEARRLAMPLESTRRLGWLAVCLSALSLDE